MVWRRQKNLLLGSILLGHVAHKINNSAGVSPLIIVPSDQLDKLRVKHNAGFGIKSRGDRVSNEILGDKILITITKETLHVTVGTGLDLSTNFLVGGSLTKFACKIYDRNIDSWDTESHASKLTLKRWNNLSNGLGSTGGRWDDVGRSGTATSPVLLGRTIDSWLSGSHGRDREDDLLGTRFDMRLARFGGKEGTGRLAKVVHTKTTPWDLRWVTGVSSLDGLTRDNKIITLDL